MPEIVKRSLRFPGHELLLMAAFFALGALSVAIHEAGHYLAALVKGIAPSAIVTGFHGINPGVTIPGSLPAEDLPFFLGAGGYLAGSVFLLTYIPLFARTCRKGFRNRWWTSTAWLANLCILFWALFQFANGFIESELNYGYKHNPYLIQAGFLAAMVAAAAFSILATHYFRGRAAPQK